MPTFMDLKPGDRVVYRTPQGQKLGGKSERTKELRSMTPMGFARAFCAANSR